MQMNIIKDAQQGEHLWGWFPPMHSISEGSHEKWWNRHAMGKKMQAFYHCYEPLLLLFLSTTVSLSASAWFVEAVLQCIHCCRIFPCKPLPSFHCLLQTHYLQRILIDFVHQQSHSSSEVIQYRSSIICWPQTMAKHLVRKGSTKVS